MAIGRLADCLTIALFIASISGMAVISLDSAPNLESLERENRRPAKAPTLPTDVHSLKKLPAEIESYFNDRLAFRESLLRWHARAKTDLGASITDKVIVGKDGWLFLNPAKSEIFGRGAACADDQFNLWSAALKERHEWLAERGITYLVVITPEKQSVYPEYLPAKPVSESVSASDLLRRWLKESSIPWVDLLPPLQAARAQGPLYFRTDTHWNDRAGYIAYQATVNRLASFWPKMKPIDRDQFEGEQCGRVGELGKILRFPADTVEMTEYLHLRKPRARLMDIDVGLDPKLHAPQDMEAQVWSTGDARLPRCVVFHDSFAAFVIRPVLAEHFELVAFAPTASLDPDVVERFRPQIVIQQIVERKLDWHQPVTPKRVTLR